MIQNFVNDTNKKLAHQTCFAEFTLTLVSRQISSFFIRTQSTPIRLALQQLQRIYLSLVLIANIRAINTLNAELFRLDYFPCNTVREH